MERVEALKLKSNDGEQTPAGEGMTLESPTLQAKRIRASLGRWVIAAGSAQLLFFTLVMALFAQKLDAQRRDVELHRAETQAVAAELGVRTDALKSEVLNLRQSLIAGSSEDVVFLKMLILKPTIEPALARSIAASIHRNAELYGRDPNLVLAIIAVESDFNPKAISHVGAEGLMQVMPHWKKVLGISGNLTDPEVSVHYGLQILGFYEEMYKDLNMALTAYNRGPGPVDSALMKGASPNNGYTPKIMSTYERLKALNVKAGGT